MIVDVALGILLAIAVLAVLIFLFVKRDTIAGLLVIGGIGAAIYYLPWKSLVQWAVIILFLMVLGVFLVKRDQKKQRATEEPYKDAIDREFERRRRF